MPHDEKEKKKALKFQFTQPWSISLPPKLKLSLYAITSQLTLSITFISLFLSG